MTDLAKISTALASSSLFAALQETNDKLAGGDGGYNRISLKGGKFRQIVGGEQVNVSKEDTLPIIIIDAAPISKTYYEGEYDPSNSSPPTCWSSDSKVPDKKVPDDQKQADKCVDCPQAVKGSGQGNTAACRYSQRLAIALEGDFEEVYQLSLPAKSLFGSPEAGHMPMQAYAKHLKSHKVPAACLVTDMYFDEDSDTPKVFFKPNRMLKEAELEQVVELRDSDDVKRLLEMSVSEAEAAKPAEAEDEPEQDDEPKEKAKPKTRAKPKAKPKAKPEEVEDDEEIEEPKKVSKKKPEIEDVDDDLAGLIDEWDD